MDKRRLTLYAAATACLAVYAWPAKADLVLLGGTVAASFTDVGAQGFGNAPRVLTEQTNGYEQGLVRPDTTGALSFPTVLPNNAAPNFDPNLGNNAIANGNFKGAISTINALGWQSGSDVRMGFNSDQTGNSGITLQQLTIGLFGPIGGGIDLLQTFSTAGATNFTTAQLGLQQGNGNGLFLFVLDATERALWDSIVAAHPGENLIVGAAAILGCGPLADASCMPTNDGPDSFRAIVGAGGTLATPLPAAVWLFASGIGGLFALTRRRRKSMAV